MSPSHPAEHQRVPTLTEVIDLSSPAPTAVPPPGPVPETALAPASNWADAPSWPEHTQPWVDPQPLPAAPASDTSWSSPAVGGVEGDAWAPNVAQWANAAPAPALEADLLADSPLPPTVDAQWEAELSQRILGNVQRQVDLMLDYRLREALMPTLARVADSLVRELRVDLASTLQDVVARAVAQELARHRSR